MPYEVGSRIGAFLSGNAKTKTIEFLGYGTYQGHHVPEGAVGWIADGALKAQSTNPKLVLDNGDVVWGCECWWGPEAAIKAKLESWKTEGWTIVEVRMPDIRAAYIAKNGPPAPEPQNIQNNG